MSNNPAMKGCSNAVSVLLGPIFAFAAMMGIILFLGRIMEYIIKKSYAKMVFRRKENNGA